MTGFEKAGLSFNAVLIGVDETKLSSKYELFQNEPKLVWLGAMYI